MTSKDGSYTIDLTGPASHVLKIEPGVGSLVIAPPPAKADLHVGAEQAIDWRVFDRFTVPAGYPWPRFLHYAGGDAGFFDWAISRPIEDMDWRPILAGDRAVDATAARIGSLGIELAQGNARLHLVLPGNAASPHLRLTLAGELSRIQVEGDLPAFLKVRPRTGGRRGGGSFAMPDLGMLHGVEHLEVQSAPMAQPVSLAFLARFTGLKSLELWGSFTDLEVLAEQRQLETLALRYVPDLTGLPDLVDFPALDGFIGFNIEEIAGKRLRKQIAAREKVRAWGSYTAISKLRKAEWWTSEYGRPFSNWPARAAKRANATYDAALTALAGATTLAQAEAALSAFTRHFNGQAGIETGEREDLADAVWQLAAGEGAQALGVTAEMAGRWFDAAREY